MKRRTKKENDRERTLVYRRWWREKNLRRKSSFATIRPLYPPPVWSLFFCIEDLDHRNSKHKKKPLGSTTRIVGTGTATWRVALIKMRE